ncbi:RNA 2',3'-cyclic phosphodiesterase [Phycicoccus endophyticus]|uniref:RNA 2',3'-cyclic phosphodiesterase n=2 Tax=Phycicoccus endophyticus TaxID=1690220 RepID=A0A7G9R5L6_9MICO|nr:RNA 2',3'-cyclic phosphodiesterase [Phycicoccus endophyticus]QNN50891.1 RNA 2',3'-cyclic phosphodiesterase [Phycicoccus endophyticus]GGL28068.1 RNA 2',3'-cyclic phosphodiesterase [Phycicoccus endophyticus]
MRVFVAVVPPEPVLEHLEHRLEPRRATPGPRWTPPGQWHLTLAFAGDAPARTLEPLLERLREVAARHPAPHLRVRGAGCFPDVTRARVLWAGLAADEGLARLAAAARSALAVAGAAPQGGPFVPHLTLARFPRPLEATRWVRVLHGYEGPPWVADELVLVESHLPRSAGHRPRHETLAGFPFAHAPTTG